ncbi:MAG: transglutaminase family protein [Rhodospirillales bacterium]|nr:transglutaminase family protein [Rhodospirillales bacterium]
MIYRLRHVTRYDYQTPVDLGVHLAHLLPRALPTQDVLGAALSADPAPSWRRDARDHFGNAQAWLFVDAPHAALEVTLEARVAVRPRPLPEPLAGPAWEDVTGAAIADPAAAEFRFARGLAAPEAEATEWAARSFPPGCPALAGLVDLNARIHREFRFRAGVTDIATPVAEILRRREGVCQDFTHMMLAMLRGLGLPGRYVSGYIRTRPAPGQPRRLGADQSHAWVGAWAGAALGWIDLDPTNGIAVGEEHVTLGWGRDYADIAPLRGVILGGGGQTLSVAVELEPVTDAA